ncbi:hypothetical protein B0A48_17697 [Cryoendolithus antarcticus]|uniref:Heterokaryon incompatibility domain-containing protein n=1 Tax=Cryoendolithus antarcticus TaxID=1507870 RepID=A0A1V8SBB1_9PEZI|nr:hypothetical protein B0A48_17697 [Cryoendolithus antarcticus]
MAALKEGQIRLLHFHNKLDDDVIRLDGRTYDRAEAPSYTALSYEWGLPTSPGAIVLNGESRSVRRNLYNALAYLPDHITGPVWVDALCIDQANAHERNHQVRAMGEIYGCASLVIAWLGLMDNAIRPCFAATGLESLAVVRAARDALVRRRYWTRLWVYQELILARQARIVCGYGSMTYADLETLLWSVDGDYDTHRICYAVSRGPTYDLCEALAQFSTCQCADERDRIFAVLSIVGPDERKVLLQILPEYSTTMKQLIDMARIHVRNIRTRGNVGDELAETALDVLAHMYGAPLLSQQSLGQGTTLVSGNSNTAHHDVLARQGHVIDPAFNPDYAPLRSPMPRPAFWDNPAFNPDYAPLRSSMPWPALWDNPQPHDSRLKG